MPDIPKRRRARRRLDHGILPKLLGYQLRLAQIAVFRDFDASVGTLGVSPGRAGMLLLIEANAGLSQNELAEAVGLDRSTLVPILHAFERRGWVTRRRGTDRRTNGLWPTARGRRLLLQIKRRIQAHEARIAARLSANERARLIALLVKLRSAE